MADIEQLALCVTCHAWNADRTRLAVCPNNNEIHIYKKDSDGWSVEHKLTEHDQVVTGIDWAPRTNRIVSCSQDRNAYVWTLQGNVWKPTLVILRINRAATHVKWSPQENKFAVASGAKCVAVCYFEEDNDWWVSKHIKKHKSTVLSVDWHPNNVLIATGSSDFKTRIFSAYIKNVDKKTDNTPWGNKLEFGNPLFEWEIAGGWVQSVAFSPSGNRLAFCAHDSSMNFVDIGSGNPEVQRILLSDLPLRCILWVNENAVVGAGHGCKPLVFANKGGKWELARSLDAAEEKKGPAATGVRASFETFANKVNLGGEEGGADTVLNTKHQNCISYIAACASAGGKITSVSTTGLDGYLVTWDVKTIA